MNTEFDASFVLPDGTLDERLLSDREPLYTGMNGKTVERIKLISKGLERSYIFKPLTNAETLGREPWLYRHMLPRLAPAVRYPALLAHAPHEEPASYWQLFEDVGRLEHDGSEEALLQAAPAIAEWHRLPLEAVPGHYAGHKPSVSDVVDTVLRQEKKLRRVLSGCAQGGCEHGFESFMAAVRDQGNRLIGEIVVSHGDFHQGNYALAPDTGELVVLDWEHAHRNSAFWDLYHLIDMTHPLYRKTMTPGSRRRAILVYVKAREAHGWKGYSDDFLRRYHLFAAVFSAWMLLLIEGDIERGGVGGWDLNQLTAQKQETCAAYWDNVNDYFGMRP